METILNTTGSIAEAKAAADTASAEAAPLQPSAKRKFFGEVRSVSILEMGLKRIFDFISIAVILALFGWLMLIIVACIKISSPGPVVFAHVRVGRLGKPFRCYKFRSMVPNAQEVLHELLARDPAALAEWNRDFKLKDDPRITRIGKFLRKTSLDELPQLWNVLIGDMSIVGPRPVVRKELSQYYGSGRRHYLSVRPGLTGLWQVSGRNDMSYDERVELDCQYVETWNVLIDFQIVMKTVGVIFGRHGAY
jgi:Undecaprenyl-phosphate galactose phosphotransferase WbaP